MDLPENSRPSGPFSNVTSWLTGISAVLTVAASVMAIFSDDVRVVRLAVILGIWTFVCLSFAVHHARKDAKLAEMRRSEAKHVYELELQREVSARREHEVRFTEQIRASVSAEHSKELAELREQVERLNTTLAGLIDGDLLFERLTLSSESTRLRSVTEATRGRVSAGRGEQRQIPVAEPFGPQLPEAFGPQLPDAAPAAAETDLDEIIDAELVESEAAEAAVSATGDTSANPTAAAPVPAAGTPTLAPKPTPAPKSAPDPTPKPVAEPAADPKVAEPAGPPPVFEPILAGNPAGFSYPAPAKGGARAQSRRASEIEQEAAVQRAAAQKAAAERAAAERAAAQRALAERAEAANRAQLAAAEKAVADRAAAEKAAADKRAAEKAAAEKVAAQKAADEKRAAEKAAAEKAAADQAAADKAAADQAAAEKAAADKAAADQAAAEKRAAEKAAAEKAAADKTAAVKAAAEKLAAQRRAAADRIADEKAAAEGRDQAARVLSVPAFVPPPLPGSRHASAPAAGPGASATAGATEETARPLGRKGRRADRRPSEDPAPVWSGPPAFVPPPLPGSAPQTPPPTGRRARLDETDNTPVVRSVPEEIPTETNPPAEAAAGGHAEGMSVAELLASYRNDSDTPRRRRRSED